MSCCKLNNVYKSCAIIFFISFLLFPLSAFGATADIQPTNEIKPTEAFTGAGIAGNNTYAQINPTVQSHTHPFVIEDGTLTLTGALGGQLNTNSNTAINLQPTNTNSTLVLQKGTLNVNGLTLGNNVATSSSTSSILLIGSGGSQTPGSTVTINGNIRGVQANMNTASIIETNGANLQINGEVSGSAKESFIGQMRAWNGNITINTRSTGAQTHIGTLSVHSGQTVNVNNRLVTFSLDLQPHSTVNAYIGDFYNQLTNNGNSNSGMQANSTFSSATSIIFRKSVVGDMVAKEGGINGASGTLQAAAYIDGGDFDLLQGNGNLTLKAGTNITARNIKADNVEAGGTITAETISGQNIHAGGSFNNVKTITGTTSISGDNDITASQSIAGGDVTAGKKIVAPIVTGRKISAGTDIQAETVSGTDVSAGGEFVNAKTITGTSSVSAGQNLNASESIAGGAVTALNGDISAPKVSGTDITAGNDINATELSGTSSITAGSNITAKTVTGGAIDAKTGNITADSVSGTTIHTGGSIANGKTISGAISISGDNDVAASESITGGAITAGRNIVGGNVTGTAIRAGLDIIAENLNAETAVAQRDIFTQKAVADELTAGRNMIAGTAPADGQIALQSADRPISPTGSLTASKITAPFIAAGELDDKPGVPSHVEADNILIVQNPGDNGSSGNFTLQNGSFAFKGNSPVGAAEYGSDGSIISHDEAAWIGGNMSVSNNGKSSFTSLGVGNLARISGGELAGAALNSGSVILHDGVDAKIATLSLTNPSSGSLQIGAAGDTASQTKVAIDNLRLGSRDMFVGADSGRALGSIGKFANSIADNYIDGRINVGHNGLLALGGSVSSLQGFASAAGMRENSAVLGVFSPMIAGYGMHVDSSLSMPQGRARSLGRAGAGIDFSDNSLLVIDGSKKGVNYEGSPQPTASLPENLPGAIASAEPVAANVENGAKIYIDRVTPGHTYIALGKNIQTVYGGEGAWKGANLLSSNPLLGLERLENGMEGQFSVQEKAKAAKVIGVTSGVPRVSRTASETMEDAIYHRIRLGEEDRYRRNFAVWALPIYESISHFGFDGGEESYGYSGGLGGIAVGADYTWEGMLRGGIALNLGGGYVRSNGELEVTKNNFNFWGLGLYGVWKPSNFSLDVDANFTSVYNKVRQELPGEFSGAEIKADIPAWSIGAGMRAQYEIVTDYITLRPHIGFRYFHLETSSYGMTLNGEDVMHADRAYQNVWTFPVGLVFTHNFKFENGYEITPLINLKAVPASGDTYMKNTVRYTGSHKDLEFDTQVMDDITWGGRAGVEFRAGDFTAGINYTAQFGSHTSNQGFFGVLRYEF